MSASFARDAAWAARSISARAAAIFCCVAASASVLALASAASYCSLLPLLDPAGYVLPDGLLAHGAALSRGVGMRRLEALTVRRLEQAHTTPSLEQRSANPRHSSLYLSRPRHAPPGTYVLIMFRLCSACKSVNAGMGLLLTRTFVTKSQFHNYILCCECDFCRYETRNIVAKRAFLRYETRNSVTKERDLGKSLSEADLASVEVLLRDRPDGLSIRDLAGADATEARRRAIQRRLNKLMALGRVRSAGASRNTRYFLAAQPGPAVLLHKDEAMLEEGGLFVPVSSAGQDLQKLLQRPEQERAPVGYNRKLLSDYKPNSTYYLTPRERKYLAEISRVESSGPKPAGTYARQILNRLLIDLSWASSRLEGNTYSILDTHLLLEQGKVAEGKSAAETQMIMNHKEAIEFLVDAANEIGFNRHTILNLHSLLANNLLEPQATGRLRQGLIGIGKSVYVPLQVPQIIEECFGELLAKAEAISNPFEQSFFATIQLPYLQPFLDVNKRVSRFSSQHPFHQAEPKPTFLHRGS